MAAFDHVNLGCHNKEAMVAFFEGLGVATVGDRPPSRRDGFWMYDETNHPIIHISPPDEGERGAAVMNHFAMRADVAVADMEQRATALGCTFDGRANAATGVYQLKIEGPEGLIFELLLPLSEQ